MDFSPLNSEHAILSAGFVVAFDGPVSRRAIDELRSRKEIRAELPATQNTEMMEVQVVPSGETPAAPRKFGGIQLSHLRPDGTPAWALRLMGQELVVECTRYTRWEKVWPSALKYLQAGLEAVGRDAGRENEVKVRAVGQAFVDAFIANRPDYDIGTLLKRDGELVVPKVFTSGQSWHSHVGWFDAPQGSDRCLNQLNVDAVAQVDASGPQQRVHVLHNQELRLTDLAEPAKIQLQLDSIMRALHFANKTVLRGLLTAEMADRIGLGRE